MEEVAGINDMAGHVIEKDEQFTRVAITHKGKPAANVTFGPTNTTVVLEKGYTNWSKSIVKTAKMTAGVK